METFVYLIDRFGIAVAILIVLGIGFWKACGWWAPRIEKWVNAWMESSEKTQQTHRDAVAMSLDLQKSNSLTLQGFAITLKAVHDRVQKFPDAVCPLDPAADASVLINLIKEARAQRKLSESRPSPSPAPAPPSPQSPQS